ncbi:hypothetical protein SFR_6783 [Streptomyces sp. FR-008]|nr:hypothetical protein SFR_6783 [Streptomyces sp. FR-008]
MDTLSVGVNTAARDGSGGRRPRLDRERPTYDR